ncbi:hypothetical protein [uncultured Psychrobacter sp.]|uniref:hypothetical protein n=1 Tax=uncultured Psychrobacter sp. TaxID=259303 RepID=UPI0030DAE45A
MAIFGEDKGNSVTKINLKEMSAFFLILLIIVGVFSFIGYKYNNKVDTTVDGLLEQKGMSALSVSKAEKKAEKLEAEILYAQHNLQRVEDLLSNEKSKLKRKKEDAINEVAALEEEIEIINLNSKRVSNLLDKQRQQLEAQKADAIAEVAEKEAELEAEHARIDKLYKEEMIKLEEKKQKAIDLVAAKNDEIEALEKGDTANNEKETVKKNEEYRLDDGEAKKINLAGASESKDSEELKDKEEQSLSSKEKTNAKQPAVELKITDGKKQGEVDLQINTNASSLKSAQDSVDSFFMGLIKGFIAVICLLIGLGTFGWVVVRLTSY